MARKPLISYIHKFPGTKALHITRQADTVPAILIVLSCDLNMQKTSYVIETNFCVWKSTQIKNVAPVSQYHTKDSTVTAKCIVGQNFR